MKFNNLLLTALLMGGAAFTGASQEVQKLQGNPYIPQKQQWNFAGEGRNEKAFDGNVATYGYANDGGAANFLGFDLGLSNTQMTDEEGNPVFDAEGNPTYAPNKAVISKIRWMSLNNANNNNITTELGIFMGANDPDFLDAVPIYIIKKDEELTHGVWHEAEITCSKAFRYLKYVAPRNRFACMAEIEFYGTYGEGSNDQLYTLTALPTVVFNSVEKKGCIESDNKDATAVKGGCGILSTREGDTSVLPENGLKTRLKERGNGSRAYPKHPWSIKFDEKKQPLNAGAKQKKWVLLANYIDKTLIRNTMAYDISEKMGAFYTVWHQPVDVVVNGVYWGNYLLCDQLEVKKGRIGGKNGKSVLDRVEDDPEYPKDENEEAIAELAKKYIDGDYHIEIDAYAEQEAQGQWFKTVAAEAGYEIPVTVKEPEWDPHADGTAAAPTLVMNEYISGKFSNLMREVKDFNVFNNTSYRDHLDLKGWFQHLVLNDICGNNDGIWSVHVYKKTGDDKFYPGIGWDFDLALGNPAAMDQALNDAKKDKTNPFLFQHFPVSAGAMREVVNKIMTDPVAQKTLYDLTQEIREKGLTKEWMLEQAKKRADEIAESRELNFKVWRILEETIGTNHPWAGSMEAEIQRMTDFITSELDYVTATAEVYKDASVEGKYSLQIVPDSGNGNLLLPGEETKILARVYNLDKMQQENGVNIEFTCDDPENWNPETFIYKMPADAPADKRVTFTAKAGAFETTYTLGSVDINSYAIEADNTTVSVEAKQVNAETGNLEDADIASKNNTSALIDGGKEVNGTGGKFEFVTSKTAGYSGTVLLEFKDPVDIDVIEILFDAIPGITEIYTGNGTDELTPYATYYNFNGIAGQKRNAYFNEAKGVKVLKIVGSDQCSPWGLQIFDIKVYGKIQRVLDEELYTLRIEPLTTTGNVLRAGEETKLTANLYKNGSMTPASVPPITIECDDPTYWDAATGTYRMPDGAENHFAHFTAEHDGIKATYTVGTIDPALYLVADGIEIKAEVNEGNAIQSTDTDLIYGGGGEVNAFGNKIFVFTDKNVDGYEGTVTLTLPEATDLGAIEIIWDANPRITEIKTGASIDELQEYGTFHNYTDIPGDKRQGYFKAAKGVKVIQVKFAYPSPQWGIKLRDIKLYKNDTEKHLMLSAARTLENGGTFELMSVFTDMQGNFTEAYDVVYEAEHGSFSGNQYTASQYFIGYDTITATDGNGNKAEAKIYIYPKSKYQAPENITVTSSAVENLNYALLFDGGDDILNAGRDANGNQTGGVRISPNLNTEESKNNASWIQFEFSEPIYFHHIAFTWEGASPEAYKVYVSDTPRVEAAPGNAPRKAPADAKEIYSFENRTQGGTVTDYITPDTSAKGKYLLVDISKNHTVYGVQMYEAKVYGNDEERPTDVERIETPCETSAEYYNLQGLRILNPEKGQILIRKQGSKVDKIILR